MKRILYMLDYGTSDTEALRLMRALSDAGEPELTGLYVEDEDLERDRQLGVVRGQHEETDRQRQVGDLDRLAPGHR